MLTVQTGSNTRLKEAFGEALPAVILSSSPSVILLIALIAVTLSARTPCPSLASLASSGQLSCPYGQRGQSRLRLAAK